MIPRNDFAARRPLAIEMDEDYRREALEAYSEPSPLTDPIPPVAHPAIAFTGCRECDAPRGAPCFTSPDSVHYFRAADFAKGAHS